MKTETRSFYETAVQRAVTRITGELDQALDLAQLARQAALSPLHFHRVFRGMVGETPVELHRRLRLERAAHQLITTEAQVTRVAFDAGYETHEAFTRVFRAHYGAPPSQFRQGSQAALLACARPYSFEIAARSGLHFQPGAGAPLEFQMTRGEVDMNVEVKTLPEKRVGAVRHVGPYNRISEAFEKLGAIAGRAGLFGAPGVEMIALYHDDPESTAVDQLRSDAGLTIPVDRAMPDGLTEHKLSAGRYACAIHHGGYKSIGDSWARFMGEWLPQSGHRVREGLSFEIYRNTPMDTAEKDLITEMYLPIV